MILLLGFYLLGALATLFAAVKLLMLAFSSRSRADLRRHPWTFLLLAMFLAIFWLAPWGSALGYVGAKLDATHRLALTRSPFPGLHNSQRPVFARILRDRYGISCPSVNSCLIISRHDISFDTTYNTVMRAAITRHYGRDIISECEQAARDETGS